MLIDYEGLSIPMEDPADISSHQPNKVVVYSLMATSGSHVFPDVLMASSEGLDRN